MSRFLSVTQAAKLLEVAPNTVINWHRQNLIPGMWKEPGAGGRYRVPTQWVHDNTPEARHQQALRTQG